MCNCPGTGKKLYIEALRHVILNTYMCSEYIHAFFFALPGPYLYTTCVHTHLFSKVTPQLFQLYSRHPIAISLISLKIKTYFQPEVLPIYYRKFTKYRKVFLRDSPTV